MNTPTLEMFMKPADRLDIIALFGTLGYHVVYEYTTSENLLSIIFRRTIYNDQL